MRKSWHSILLFHILFDLNLLLFWTFLYAMESEVAPETLLTTARTGSRKAEEEEERREWLRGLLSGQWEWHRCPVGEWRKTIRREVSESRKELDRSGPELGEWLRREPFQSKGQDRTDEESSVVDKKWKSHNKDPPKTKEGCKRYNKDSSTSAEKVLVKS